MVKTANIKAEVRQGVSITRSRHFGPKLQSISEHFVADTRTNGGSMFRIYRDVRFSKDKSPYKTQAAAHFRHEVGKSAHAPGFYLHLAPDEVFAGVGLWQPDSATLGRIRNRIASNPQRWERASKDPAFLDAFELTGRSLKRPPKGFDADHPCIEDLKRKDHIAACMFDEEEATSPGFLDDFADACRMALALHGVPGDRGRPTVLIEPATRRSRSDTSSKGERSHGQPRSREPELLGDTRGGRVQPGAGCGVV